MSLPRNHRLVMQRQSIAALRRKGRYISTPILRASYQVGQGEYSRFGVVIGAQISKKAVIRNRLRRLLHEAIIANMPKEKIDMVLFPKKEMAQLMREEIAKEVHALLKKLS